MAEAVYILCTLTCLACTILLLRAYRASGARLLLWSGLCFAGLTMNNFVLYLDLSVFAEGPDLSLYRNLIGAIAMGLLMFGLVWETE